MSATRFGPSCRRAESERRQPFALALSPKPTARNRTFWTSGNGSTSTFGQYAANVRIGSPTGRGFTACQCPVPGKAPGSAVGATLIQRQAVRTWLSVPHCRVGMTTAVIIGCFSKRTASPSVRTDPAGNDHQPGSETSRLAALVVGHALVAQAARRGDYATPAIALAVRRVWNGPCGISGGAKLSELARSQRLYQSASSGNSSPPSRNPSGR